MKTVLFILLAVLLTDPKKISKINEIKKEAEIAFLSQNYEVALSKYMLLRDSLAIDDPAINLNIAHAHYYLGDSVRAKNNYSNLSSSPHRKLKSIALQQLGVMNKDAGKLEEALQQLKAAIKTDPTNQEARYNYEVLKKQLEEQKQQNQDQDQQNQEQDGQDEKKQENKDQQKDGEQEEKEGEEGENQEKSEEEKENQEKKQQENQEGEEEKEEETPQEQMTKEKLEEMGISQEKAMQLLEAMRQNEIKYLQHQRRKPTKRPPSGKPDW